MSDLQNKLEDEIASQLEAMSNYAVGDEEKRRGTENVEKLYKLLMLEKEREQKDADLKLREREVKIHEDEIALKRLENRENTDFKLREFELKDKEIRTKSNAFEKGMKVAEVVLQAGAIIIPAALYDRIADQTFNFEKDNFVTSSFGKSLIRVLSPKSWFSRK